MAPSSPAEFLKRLASQKTGCFLEKCFQELAGKERFWLAELPQPQVDSARQGTLRLAAWIVSGVSLSTQVSPHRSYPVDLGSETPLLRVYLQTWVAKMGILVREPGSNVATESEVEVSELVRSSPAGHLY